MSAKLDNTLVPSTPEEIENTVLGLISLLEKGTENPKGSLNFLISNWAKQKDCTPIQNEGMQS